MTLLEKIGKNIYANRKFKRISQEKLAGDAGMSASHLRSIEHGKGNPTVETLLRISKSLDIDVRLLLEDVTTARSSGDNGA